MRQFVPGYGCQVHLRILFLGRNLRGFANNQTGTGTLAKYSAINGVGMSPGSILRRRVAVP